MKDEKWNERLAITTAVGVHAALLLLFFLITAWRAPDPPVPEYGVELNFGMDAAGSGEEQPAIPIKQGEETAAEEEKKPAETPASEEPAEALTSEENNEVTIPEEKKEKKAEVPKAEPRPEAAKTEKEVSKAAEDTRGKVKGKADGAPSGGTQGQGDEGVLGDRGNPQGTIDGKALYGGGGGNGTLNMAGWEWATKPKLPSLEEHEGGRIVFEIECDETGEIVGIKTLERGVSVRVEQLLQAEIHKTSLMRNSGRQAPHRSKGTVLFIVKAK